jgi:hypothetical protein
MVTLVDPVGRPDRLEQPKLDKVIASRRPPFQDSKTVESKAVFQRLDRGN